MSTSLNLSLFKLDTDELINGFIEGGSTSFAAWKNLCSRGSSPAYMMPIPLQLVLFYAVAIGYMISIAQACRSVLSLLPIRDSALQGELNKIKIIVVEAKEKRAKVLPSVVQKMLEKNMFLFGSVDLNESSVCEMVNELRKLQNTRIKIAYDKYISNLKLP